VPADLGWFVPGRRVWLTDGLPVLPTLGSGRVSLREMRSGDTDGYARRLTHPTEARFITDVEISLSAVPRKLEANRRAWEQGRAAYWTIEQAGQFAGFIALHRPHAVTAALSYAVLQELRRSGVASEALRLVLAYASAQLETQQVHAATHLDNDASSKLLRSLEFEDLGEGEAPGGIRRRFVKEVSPACP